MFEEPEESASERGVDPKARANDKAEEARIHAELAAVFEGPRKFDAEIYPLEHSAARDIQRAIGKLEKARQGDHSLLPPPSWAEAAAMLTLHQAREIPSNDYHISSRPGEIIIVRWLEADQIDPFYERFQAHFNAGVEGFKEDERQAHGWKQDPKTVQYLEALDAIELKMDEHYRRDLIQKHKVFVLSTLTSDEINIAFLAETIMGRSVADVFGEAAAPPDDPAEQDLAWFFKLFSLRGIVEDVERMCFFAYMQKSEESW